MWLIKASLKNPYMVAALCFLLVFLGSWSILIIPKDILPVFKSPAVQVLTYFPGMPARAVEKTITNRIERWVNQAPGAVTVEGKSLAGVSVVKVYFRDDVDPNAALTMVQTLALSQLPTLPPNTLPPVTLPFDPTATLPLGMITVRNKRLGEAQVKDIARIELRNSLGNVPGVVAPVVIGGKDRTILVYLNRQALEARRLSALSVVRALQDGNLMVSLGSIYFGDNQASLDSNALVKDVSDLNDLPIRIEAGRNVYLRDVAEAKDASSIQTSRVRIDGKQQVYVPVYRQGGASSLSVVEGARKALPLIQQKVAAGTKLDFVMDQSVYVREAINSLLHEGGIGILLVGLMIYLFLGNFRMTLIASLSIPLALFGAMIGLYTSGNTINTMTLSGLALAIGPLVDDAIVELENNHRHATMGKSRIRAALDSAAEVMVPVMVATCTTSIVLAPLALIPGMGGFLFRPLAMAVAFAMFSSFILSRTFVPMMCAKFLPKTDFDGHDGHPHPPAKGFHRYVEGVLGRLTRLYERLLAGALSQRWIVLSVALLLFVCSLVLSFGIGREFFPQVDAGQITLYVRSPSNLRLDATETRIAALEKFIESKIPKKERKMIVSELGLNPDWSSAYTPNSGQQDTAIRVQLTDDRRYSAQEYAIRLRRDIHQDGHFADLRVSFDTGGMVQTALNFGQPTPIDISITGGSIEQGARMAAQVRALVAKTPGAADVHVKQRRDAPYLLVNVDRQKAANVGLSARDVILQVVAAMNSSVSIDRNFWIDEKSGNQYFVGVQYPEDPHAHREDLENVWATGPNQQQLPVKLSSLATISDKNEPVEITHLAGQRTYDVLVNTEKRDIGSVAGDINRELDQLKKTLAQRAQELANECKTLGEEESKLSPGKELNQHIAKRQKREKERDDAAVYAKVAKNIVLKGEYARMVESSTRLVLGLAAASVLVYLLLVALFRSWVGPFIIMFTVPLGLIGVLIMLFVTKTTLNVQSQVGVIFLVGIAVNNGVLLVEFANKQRRMGLSVGDAIRNAAKVRFRPILMTFLATFLDLVPMAIGLGKGSEAAIPLARAVVGGLLSSTLLTLFVVPILYTLLIREGSSTGTEVDKELEDEPPMGSLAQHPGPTGIAVAPAGH